MIRKLDLVFRAFRACDGFVGCGGCAGSVSYIGGISCGDHVGGVSCGSMGFRRVLFRSVIA